MKKARLQISDALSQQSTDKRIDILRRIGQVGSISEAARAAGVSYKAAWQALDTLSNLAGVPLVARVVGGSGGGGAVLTPAGHSVLDAADQMNQARQEVLLHIGQQEKRLPAVANLSALALRTSMRNQFPCTVKSLKLSGGAVRVELALSSQATFFSKITKESAELLGLKAGLSVLALFKATAVAVGVAWQMDDGYNRLDGQVTRASRAKMGGEVAIVTPSGLQLVGFAPAGIVMKAGDQAMARVEESAIVIALG
jgi:molybdate transport system regulatory protein